MLMKLEFSGKMFEKCSNINFMKIHPEGAELFQAGGQTDGKKGTRKLTVACRNFANASESANEQVRNEGMMVMALQQITLVGGGTEENYEILSNNSR
jgi:hypothetical protein